MSKTIVFFGNERLATGTGTSAPILRGLIENGYNVAALVVAQNYSTQSRNQRGLEIAVAAAEHNIPVYSLEQHLRDKSPSETLKKISDIRDLGAEAGVLVAYGEIIPQELIDIFPKGIINIHPSLLPQHRGSIPIESVILNGEHTTGVSLMALAAKMDAGPVYAQEKVVLIGNETKQELARKFSHIGRDLLVKYLPAILDDSLKPTPQDDSKATYDPRITKHDGVIDWQKPAERLEREVRAYADWPRSRTKLGNIDVVITKAHVLEGSGMPGELWRQAKSLGFYTSAGILAIDSLVPAGKKEMPIEAFLNGYQI